MLIPSLAVATATCLAASAFCQQTELVSKDSVGILGSADSYRPSVSTDGRFVAFDSLAANLVPADTNGRADVFVHDRQENRTERVSVAAGGIQGNADSTHASISANGRFVAFQSEAYNLVPGDTNAWSDCFVHDRRTGSTTRVSVDSGGGQGNWLSQSPRLSANGRFVAFESLSSNLVLGDSNASMDVFLHDLQTGQTTLISVNSLGIQGQGTSLQPCLAAGGRLVAFASEADNLVPGDTNSAWDVFVRDLQTGLTVRVSMDSGRSQGNHDSRAPHLSVDGRFVSFESLASNLVAGDTNAAWDVFVHDRQTGRTTRASVDSGGAQGVFQSNNASLSAGGRRVAFHSLAPNLVPGDTNATWDIFVHDRQTGQTTRASVAAGGSQGNGGSYRPSVSADGRFVAFDSHATDLVPGDTNGRRDVFVHDFEPIAPQLATSGACPGAMTFTIHAATPEGTVAFASGAAGSFALTSGACAGTVLDLANPQLGPVVRASWRGTITRSWPITPAMCGLTVQALDVRTCKTSNTVVL